MKIAGILIIIQTTVLFISCDYYSEPSIVNLSMDPDIISNQSNGIPRIRVIVNFQKSSILKNFDEINAIVRMFNKKNEIVYEGKTGSDGETELLILQNNIQTGYYFIEAILFDDKYSIPIHYGNRLFYYPGNNKSIKKEIITYPVE